MELNALSQHENALKFRALRNRVLTTNIANADTPNFKARDFEFGAALDKAKGGSLRMAGTRLKSVRGPGNGMLREPAGQPCRGMATMISRVSYCPI